MKKFITGLFTLLMVIPILAGSQSWQWSIGMGGVSNDESFDIATLPSGISYVTGSFTGTAHFDTVTLSATGTNFFLAKMNKEGRVLWVKQGGGTGYDAGKAVAVDLSGNVYVTGTFIGNPGNFDGQLIENLGYQDIFINKYNADGVLMWTQHVGRSSGDDAITDIDVNPGGEVVITGSSQNQLRFYDSTKSNSYHVLSIPSATADCFVAKYETNSKYVGSYRIGSSTGYEISNSVRFDAAGNIIVTGIYKGDMTVGTTNLPVQGLQDIFIVKLTSNLQLSWAKKAGGTGNEEIAGLQTDPNGNIFIAGNFIGNINFDVISLTGLGKRDIFLAKYNPQGIATWAKNEGGINGQLVNGFVLGNNKKSYILGNFETSAQLGDSNYLSYGSNDLFILQMDSAGNAGWSAHTGTIKDDAPRAISKDADDNLFITGFQNMAIPFGDDTTVFYKLMDVFVAQWFLHHPKHYVFSGNGNWSNPSNWVDNNLPPVVLPNNDTIYITPLATDSCIMDTTVILENGAILFVGNYGRLIIPGNIQVTLPAPVEDSTFTDLRDGQIYTIKKYGNDFWMTQNLNYYTSSSKLYNNDTINAALYGRLYNWYDAVDAVPEGWHIPTWDEWQSLGSGQAGRNSLMATILWNCTGPTNSSGFNGRPGGIFTYGDFNFEGSQTRWWCDSLTNDGLATQIIIMCSEPTWWFLSNAPKSSVSFSLRCVKDKFTPPPPPPPPDYDTTFTDPRDGQVYPVKRYENKIWMTKNLNYNSALSKVYNNDQTNASVYGRLYNWTEAKAAVPAGWHLPSLAEWNALIELNGGINIGAGPMKDTLYWQLPNTGATNSSGFSARPGGLFAQPDFEDIGNFGLWWTSNEHSEVGSFHWAYYFQAGYNTRAFYSDYLYKDTYALSVRCVKD